MNQTLFKLITSRSGRQPLLDLVMIVTSNKSRYVYVLILIFLWFKSPTSKMVARKAILSASIAWLIRIICNIFYFRPRPFVFHKIGILIPSKTDSTLISKHTVLAFAVSTSIFLRQRLLGKILMWLSVVTGVSRVYVGHHYPSDIFRSALLGGIISYLVEKVDAIRKYN